MEHWEPVAFNWFVSSLLENSLLVVIGAAGVASQLLAGESPRQIVAVRSWHMLLSASPDARVLVFTTGITALTALLFFGCPYQRPASRAPPASMLEGGLVPVIASHHV